MVVEDVHVETKIRQTEYFYFCDTERVKDTEKLQNNS